MTLRRRLLVSTILLALAAPLPAQMADSAAFIVRLGSDTTAVERFVRVGNRIEAVSITRSPVTTTRRLTMWLTADGGVERYAQGGAAGEMREQTVADGAIPLAGSFYVPWHLAIARAARSGRTSVEVPVRNGNQTQPIAMERSADGAWNFANQFDQPVVARVDGQGRMQRFAIAGGGATVERVGWVDIDAVGRSFAARDERGRGMGALSPFDSVQATTGGVRVVVTYSRPSLRGRSLDVLVPIGQVWRTGANNATTFAVDRDVLFGDLRLAPGVYSLFALREVNGWTLIINRQTGMNGLDRDPAQDVGRIAMSVRLRDEPVETFTILVEPIDNGGVIRLRWGTVEASARFTAG